MKNLSINTTDFLQTDITSSNDLPQKQNTYDQLNQFLNQEDVQKKVIQEARDILGDSADTLTDEQVFDLVNEVQYLVDTWLEEFEKQTFDGKTLDQVLGLK